MLILHPQNSLNHPRTHCPPNRYAVKSQCRAICTDRLHDQFAISCWDPVSEPTLIDARSMFIRFL